MKIFDVEMEDPRDPYGQGTGFILTVIAKNKKQAKSKASLNWKQHPYNCDDWYVNWRPYRVKINTSVIR